MLLNTPIDVGIFGTSGYAGGTNCDAAGRVTDRGLGNGLIQKFVYHPWDTQGGRLRVIAAGSGTWDSLGLTFATPRQRLDYSYDASSNITQIGNTEAAETQTYGYDALNRLTGWSLNGNISGIYEYGETNGNLEKKGTLDLQYNNTSHPHAVSEAVTLLDYICPVGAVCDHDQEVGGSVDNTYGYDANGNTLAPGAHLPRAQVPGSAGVTSRPVNGQIYTLGYDAEGHLVSVTGGSYSAQFTYDGDGKRVKSVINPSTGSGQGGETILFTGGQYEVKIPASGSQEITKYYLAGSTRIALRKYVIPQSMEVEYILGDHLGSTALTTDAAGEKVSEMRYTPWGEVRYAWKDPGLNTTPAYALTKWTFTGQYSYADDPSTEGVEDFGLMYFNARWMDPQIGRFVQADTIIPGTGEDLNLSLVVDYHELNFLYRQNLDNHRTSKARSEDGSFTSRESLGNVQAFDRFSYSKNNPLRYIDPNGHCADTFTAPICGGLSLAGPPGWVLMGVLFVGSLAIIGYAAYTIAAADVRKPLTPDEQEKIEHMGNETEDWIQDHPDLEEEAQRQADGEETEYDHVGEAQDWVKGLENDIAHLERVRRSRDDASQAAIDRAIESTRHWIDIINRKLNGGE